MSSGFFFNKSLSNVLLLGVTDFALDVALIRCILKDTAYFLYTLILRKI